MRSLLALGLLASVVLALSAASTAAARTSLTVTYWASGADSSKPVTSTLRCAPAGGTLAKPSVACARLSSGGWRLFAPTPKNVACSEIYGGPQVAVVVGSVEGRRVWAKLQRRNGCETARWGRFAPWLVPAGSAA